MTRPSGSVCSYDAAAGKRARRVAAQLASMRRASSSGDPAGALSIVRARPGSAGRSVVSKLRIAARAAWAGYAAYSMTKFGVNGFTEALRQEITKQHVRVGVIEPGGVATEFGSHNSGDALKGIEEFYASTEVLAPEDIADAVAYLVTRPRRAAISEMWVMPTDQA